MSHQNSSLLSRSAHLYHTLTLTLERIRKYSVNSLPFILIMAAYSEQNMERKFWRI